MSFWTVLFWSYLITSCISSPIMGIRAYIIGIKRFGKRKSIVGALQVFGLSLIIPYVGFCGLIYVSFICVRDKTKNWMDQDPTSPKNRNNPNFVPPAKKEKKCNPVDSRFEILDL